MKWFVLQGVLWRKLVSQEACVGYRNFPRWNLVESSYFQSVLSGIVRPQAKLYCCVIACPPPRHTQAKMWSVTRSQQRLNQWSFPILGLVLPKFCVKKKPLVFKNNLRRNFLNFLEGMIKGREAPTLQIRRCLWVPWTSQIFPGNSIVRRSPNLILFLPENPVILAQL